MLSSLARSLASSAEAALWLLVQQDVDAGALAVAGQANQASHLAVGATKLPGSIHRILRGNRPRLLVQPVGVEGGHGLERRVRIPAGADRRPIRRNRLFDTDQYRALIDGKVRGNAEGASHVPALREGVCGGETTNDEEPADRPDNGDSDPVRALVPRPNDRRSWDRVPLRRGRKRRVHRCQDNGTQGPALPSPHTEREREAFPGRNLAG